MQDCIFCKIIARELPASVVHETDEVIAIVPLHQVAAGHTLVIPKVHSVNVLDIDAAMFRAVSDVARTLAPRLMREHGATGVNLLHAAGADAQQSVFHFHLHIVPRSHDDGLDLWFKNKL